MAQITHRVASLAIALVAALALPACFLQDPSFAPKGFGKTFAGIQAGAGYDGQPVNWCPYFNIKSGSQLKSLPYFVVGDVKIGVKGVPGAPIYTGGGTFKPGKSEPQISLSSSKDYTNGFVGLDRKFAGTYDFRATVGVDNKKFPMDLTTTGYIQVALPGIGPGDVEPGTDPSGYFRVAALRSEFENGFRVQASNAQGLLGSAYLVGFTKRVDLRIQQTETDVIFSTRVTPADVETEGGWHTLFTLASPVDANSLVSLQFGTQLLMKGSRIYFDYFMMDGDEIAGSAEQPIIDALNNAAFILGNAAAALTGVEPNYPEAANLADDAETALNGAKQQINAAILAQSFQPTTQGELAIERIDKALAGIAKFQDATNSETPPPSSKAKSLAKNLASAREQLVVAIANMGGSTSKNVKGVPLSKEEAPTSPK